MSVETQVAVSRGDRTNRAAVEYLRAIRGGGTDEEIAAASQELFESVRYLLLSESKKKAARLIRKCVLRFTEEQRGQIYEEIWTNLQSAAFFALYQSVLSWKEDRGAFSTYLHYALRSRFFKEIPEILNYKITQTDGIKKRHYIVQWGEGEDGHALFNYHENQILRDEEEEATKYRARRVIEACERLKDREREVLLLLTIGENGNCLTLAEIGRRHGISRERVRQISEVAKAKIREMLKNDREFQEAC